MKLTNPIAHGLAGLGIEADIQRLRAKQLKILAPISKKLAKKIAKAGALRASIIFKEIDYRDIEAEAEAVNSAALQDLGYAADRCQNTERYLLAFQTEHCITWPPYQPNTFLSGAMLALMASIETYVNSLFFSNASLVATQSAALLTSGLISLTNIAASTCAGFYAGRFLEYGLNTEEPNDREYLIKRWIARFGLGVFGAVSVWLHSSIGFVRSQESLEHVEYSMSHYLELATNPEAAFLVITGASLSLIAYNKGKNSLSDRYPYHSHLGREVDDARGQMLDVYDRHQKEISGLFEQALGKDEKQLKKNIKTITRYNKAVGACEQAMIELKEAIISSENTLCEKIASLVNSNQVATPAGARKAKQPDYETLCDFKHLAEVDMPQRIDVPKTSSVSAALGESKARTLGQLAAILKQCS